MSKDIISANGQTKQRTFVDDFESPDFYELDDLFTEEHKMIRGAVRDFVKKEITPNIEDWAERNHFHGRRGASSGTEPVEPGQFSQLTPRLCQPQQALR